MVDISMRSVLGKVVEGFWGAVGLYMKAAEDNGRGSIALVVVFWD